MLAAERPNHAHEPPAVLAPGYGPLAFTPPPAGSYRLPPLGDAADGAVLDASGRDRRLHEFLGDKLVVLSFIYTTCSDVNGCPLATYVLSRLQDKLRTADDVRLVSLSFDPQNDTPAVISDYARHFIADGFDWPFLTCASQSELAPILQDYDQWVVKDYDENGRYLGSMSHVLRVYLIDRSKRIRNIYSVSYLHADTVLNDIQTLRLE